MTAALFPGFAPFRTETSGAEIAGVAGGSGPPLLLLHGYPQTHAMWHRIAPALAREFTVVAADLRGYGASSKPPTDADHVPYSKRAMALDMLEVMRARGHDRFAVVGHDRGGRVAHRLAADHPDAVARIAVLDIAPTREMYAGTTDAFARAYWHWFFLIRPAPIPETAILSDPKLYWEHKTGGWAGGPSPFDPQAKAAYLAAWTEDTIRASCEDYRAAAAIDIRHDDADGEVRLPMPLLALWGADGVVARCFDPLALWRARAEDVTGQAIPGGHFLAEESPDETLAALLPFLRA
ncbi:MAG: alpha/beta fold hydrolase [Hasllibacter sp.]